MPALRQANWNVSDGDLQSSTTNYAQAGRDQVYENPSSPTESPRHSVSSLPYPFDSQSSLENDNGSHAWRRSLIARIIDTFQLSKSYLPGHVKGDVDQIIHSHTGNLDGFAITLCYTSRMNLLLSNMSWRNLINGISEMVIRSG
ncbi:hypothetical protein HO173_004427 [Letharia columbiana]|uniref:Uncharacterized protein n=1 Tax=Letharia columbiana TaxID=112416 RepID=A0A8H6FZ92_9LECA|nr:uncharacterized protein HO173_004427 [Letharia columbiana]KAF6237537.1 hypothetical protein HO173_004427 [Letharia columbiana]